MAENTSNAQLLRINKMQAGHRQRNVAIRLHFEGGDPIAVVTLAGEAFQIFADLVEHRCPKGSRDQSAPEVIGLSPRTYPDALRKAQHFLRHADRDARDVLEWSSRDIEALILAAIMNAEQLDGLSLSECIYRLWYFAKHMKPEFAPALGAAELFPEIAQLPDREQRARGAEVLLREYARVEREGLRGNGKTREEAARP